MTRAMLATGVLVLGVCAVPMGAVLGFALVAPDQWPRWVAFFVALALGMIGGSFGPDWVEGWQRRRRAAAQVRHALHDGEQVVRVELTRADGYLVEVDGSADDHFIHQDDVVKHYRQYAENAARKSLGIPADVPVKLVMSSDDSWLLSETRGAVVPVED
ncbi:hypothetical protein K353_00365 [Kitasatospora sp. SolWspMP-SS2h]|uniref:hypothetical protein n=1 Tax=Kitasatospora sp. SolWspMP-SS2h TaxID=1305729 RepID=UPI000DB90074|nr:hypothetical protein [Kitasatospora sp. SolWspMP-SS2h]RAJ47164.1 hypothetical protein K353_00365 [Kitasatospora sp. SolWspMP-SS2h]